MDKKVITVCVVVFMIQHARAQAPNLAALLGLEGFGNLLGNMGGAGGGQPSSGSSSCPYTAHADRRKFTQMVNNRVMTQECAPGTMFVQSKCSCDNIPQGGNGNGPMPGSNPRLESSMGGGAGGNPMIAALMSQLDAAFGGPTRAPRPSPRNNSPMNTNELNAIRHKITSGIRPDQTNVGNNNKPPQRPKPVPNDVQYNLGPNMGLTSVVDPSILPDVLPPEILNVLQGGNNAPPSKSNNRPGNEQLPPSVQQMLERANKLPTKRPIAKTTPSRKQPTSKQPAVNSQQRPTKPPSVGLQMPPGGMPNDVLQMLQKSINPPSRGPKRVRNSKAKAKKAIAKRLRAKAAAQKPPPKQMPTRKQPSKKTHRRRLENKPPQVPQQDPLAELMAQMNRQRSQKTAAARKQSNGPRNGPRNDPLAALLGSMNQPPSRSSSSRTQRNNQNRTPSNPNVGVPGADPMAAMLASLGGGTNPAAAAGLPALPAMPALPGGTGGSAKTLTSLMATMTGGVPSSNDMAALAAGLGGPNSGAFGGPLPRMPGSTGYVDMTNFFNAQGIMQGSTGGLSAGLSGLNNLNYLKLHTLDRHEVIDLGDLTPAGLLAANSHFANVDVPPYIPSGTSLTGLTALTALNNAAAGGVNTAPPAIFG